MALFHSFEVTWAKTPNQVEQFRRQRRTTGVRLRTRIRKAQARRAERARTLGKRCGEMLLARLWRNIDSRTET